MSCTEILTLRRLQASGDLYRWDATRQFSSLLTIYRSEVDLLNVANPDVQYAICQRPLLEVLKILGSPPMTPNRRNYCVSNLLITTYPHLYYVHTAITTSIKR